MTELDPLRRRAFTGIVCENKKEEKMAEYIVWTPDSPLPPRVVHKDRQTAIRVAGRMAHENPGKTFYSCKLTNSAYKPPPAAPVEVKYEDLDR